MKIPLIKPYIPESVKDKISSILDSGYLTEGPTTKEFEEKVKDYIGCKHAIALTSCTTGLEVALRALNIGVGDEVIVPDYTYPATAAVAPIVGAKSVIVDIDKDTMNIDYDKLETAITNKTKAIIPVSLFGNPLDYNKLNAIKEKYNLYIIEDAACSIGAKYNGIKVGNFADITVFSCHPRKFITTGEGGIIATNNTEWANWMNSYKHFGMNMTPSDRGSIEFEMIGTNYKLSNILAAIGLSQMEIIDALLAKRQKLAGVYIELLEKVKNIGIPKVTTGGIHSYQTFSIFVKNRDEIMKKMRSIGIEAQIGTYSLHMHKAFKNNNDNIRLHKNFEHSKYAFNHCLALPMYHDMTNEEQQIVVKELLYEIQKFGSA